MDCIEHSWMFLTEERMERKNDPIASPGGRESSS